MVQVGLASKSVLVTRETNFIKVMDIALVDRKPMKFSWISNDILMKFKIDAMKCAS